MFVGSCSGVVYGIDEESGAVRWTYDTRQDAGPAQFHGDPAIIGDLVLSGSDTAEPSLMYAFHGETGELAWKREADVIESDVVRSEGLVIGQTFFGDFVALDAETGERRWRLAPDERHCGRRPQAPTVDGERVFLAAADGTLKAVRVADGAVLWNRDLGCVSTALVVWRDRVWAGTPDGRVQWFDIADGEPGSAVEVGGRPHGRPEAIGEVLVLRVGERDAVAVDPAGEKVMWRFQATRELSSPRPHPYSGLALVGDAEGVVYALDPADGSVRWTVEVKGTVRGIGSGDGALYIGTLGGTVYKVAAPEGTAPAPH